MRGRQDSNITAVNTKQLILASLFSIRLLLLNSAVFIVIDLKLLGILVKMDYRKVRVKDYQ